MVSYQGVVRLVHPFSGVVCMCGVVWCCGTVVQSFPVLCCISVCEHFECGTVLWCGDVHGHGEVVWCLGCGVVPEVWCWGTVPSPGCCPMLWVGAAK